MAEQEQQRQIFTHISQCSKAQAVEHGQAPGVATVPAGVALIENWCLSSLLRSPSGLEVVRLICASGTGGREVVRLISWVLGGASSPSACPMAQALSCIRQALPRTALTSKSAFPGLLLMPLHPASNSSKRGIWSAAACGCSLQAWTLPRPPQVLPVLPARIVLDRRSWQSKVSAVLTVAGESSIGCHVKQATGQGPTSLNAAAPVQQGRKQAGSRAMRTGLRGSRGECQNPGPTGSAAA